MILAPRSWLSDSGFQILDSRSWLPDPGYQILGTRSWLPDPDSRILAIYQKAISNIGTEILFVQSEGHKTIKKWSFLGSKNGFRKLSSSSCVFRCQNASRSQKKTLFWKLVCDLGMIGPYLDVKYIKLWFVVWNKDLPAMKKRFLILLEAKKSQNNDFLIKQFQKKWKN